MKYVLEVAGLRAQIAKKEVLREVSLQIREGEVVAVVGANGGGKSSLADVLMGNEQYTVSSKQLLFEGQDISGMTVDQRAKAGLYVAWQNPVTIPGVSVFALCKAAYEASGGKVGKLVDFKERLVELAVRVGLSAEHIARFINDGFSGGEKKRLELLQLLLLKPRLAILDEIDSGLDVLGRELVVETIMELKKSKTAFLVITHYEQMIKTIGASQVLEMINGQLSPRLS